MPRGLIRYGLLNLALWLLVCGLLSGIFFAIDYFDGTTSITTGRYYFVPSYDKYTWALEASIATAIIGFNFASADTLKHIVRHHGRNTIRWTMAIILFSPFLAGIIYLLTWPKDKNE